MQEIWFAVLGVLLGGYFIGEGYALGTGVLLPLLGRSDRERRTVLAALGPFFLGNEVWLVGALGVLIGAFPQFEGELLGALYPLVVALLCFLVLRDIALHFRSREESPGWRAGWDRVLVLGSAGLSVSWGLVVGNLVQGVPDSPGGLFNPYALLCGLALPAVFVLHSAAFLALRLRGNELADAAVARGRQAFGPALALVVLAVVGGTGTGGVRSATAHPLVVIPVAVLVVLGVGLGGTALRRGAGRAFVLTSVAAALPVLLAGLALAEALRAGAADDSTLRLLNWAALPVLPVVLGYQVWLWTAFRAPVNEPAYW